ncbi:hypothetical protein F7725_006932 [Dissostichus mawsoni]|uniref:Uncharacterized protein n=1 Tax=Dissostichus mawsoni TaxID=36200 RepID=A0A7J5XVA7_DISMA|nr:hypothetical protein F7725_006932 [Dissostichus mawsoni]
MITLEGRVISEGIKPTFLTGLAAVFAIYYIFNLQYQEEAACTLEFIKRRFIGINPERGTKAIRGKVVSKKTAVISTHVSILLKNLLDFEWDFIYCSGNTGKERNKDQQGVGHLYLNQKIPLCIRTVHTHPECS